MTIFWASNLFCQKTFWILILTGTLEVTMLKDAGRSALQCCSNSRFYQDFIAQPQTQAPIQTQKIKNTMLLVQRLPSPQHLSMITFAIIHGSTTRNVFMFARYHHRYLGAHCPPPLRHNWAVIINLNNHCRDFFVHRRDAKNPILRLRRAPSRPSARVGICLRHRKNALNLTSLPECQFDSRSQSSNPPSITRVVHHAIQNLQNQSTMRSVFLPGLTHYVLMSL